MTSPLKAAVSVPTFGDFDARTLGELAAEAEEAGWDGFFCWDHLLYDPLGRGVADTTVALTAIALATRGSGSARWSRRSPGAGPGRWPASWPAWTGSPAAG